MPEKALDLFQAYKLGKLNEKSGYIVSSFFDPNSTYSRYETVAYAGVKNIYLTDEGLTFQTDGKKLHVLVEPPNYSKKYIEPVSRVQSQSIPHRFKELNIYTAKNQTKVMVSKEPVDCYSSFTILKPTGTNFSLIFYRLPEVEASLKYFFEQTLSREAAVPKADASKAALKVIEGIQNFKIW